MAAEFSIAARVSVCMATYNGAAFLRPQIDSILCQLDESDELIISDDGSTDETLSIILSYGKSIRLVASTRAGGVVPNFSRVLQFASKELVVLADQDDVWLPGRVDAIRTLLAHADLVLMNAWIVDEKLRKNDATLFQETCARPGFWRNLTKRNAFVGCCMAIRRTLLAQALPLPWGTPWHDWLIGLLASSKGRVEFCATPTLFYRRHVSNASLTGQKSRNGGLKKLEIRLRVLYSVIFCLVRWKIRRLSLFLRSSRNKIDR